MKGSESRDKVYSTRDMREREVVNILGNRIRDIIERRKISYDKLQEIRLRIGKPIIVIADNVEWVMREVIEKDEFMEILEYICKYSLYAFENELKQGFITIEGGHRVGISGQVYVENGEVKNFKNICSMNIRVSHEVLDCAKRVLPYITQENEVLNTLIVSPPRCGKTTLLRDLVRQVSDGNSYIKGCTVGIVDERSEIGGCYLGIPQNQVGMRTDILDACPKSKGMMMLVRSMAPSVIAVDELGGAEDVHAMEYAMNCGCKFIATVHGKSMEEIRKKPLFENLVKEQRFNRYVVLGNKNQIGQIEGIYDDRGTLLFTENVYV